MIGNLTKDAIRDLLKKEIVGHIGCNTGERIYVVPISYAFDGKDIYAHSYEGTKIKAMRMNTEVCFEVDDLKDMGNWQSVMAWGRYEEILHETERKEVFKLLMKRPLPVVSSITTHLGCCWPFEEIDEVIDGIFFRIHIHEMTGKYETTNESPIVAG
jgi:uncharacterized protein